MEIGLTSGTACGTMSGMLYLSYFLGFGGLALGGSLLAECFPQRSGVKFWFIVAILAGTADLVTTVAWARLLGLTFGQYEANVFAVALGPLGTIVAGAVFLTIFHAGMERARGSIDPQDLPLTIRLERIALTALAFRSAMLVVWNAVVSLAVLMST